VSWQSWPNAEHVGSRSRGTARSPSAVTEHGTPLPRSAPEAIAVLEPSPEPLTDGPMRVRCLTVLMIEPEWQDLKRRLTFLFV
jgi:hypothetical protein